jgi:hypothetical protein
MSDDDTVYSEESDYDYTEAEVLEIWERNTRYAAEHGHYPKGPSISQETTTPTEPIIKPDTHSEDQYRDNKTNNVESDDHAQGSEEPHRYLTEQNRLLWEELC